VTVDPHVTVGDPAQFRKPLHQCRNARLSFWIVCVEVYEHTDAPHSFRLLRPHRERPRRRRAAEEQ
jgi:hypothetical protein